MTELSLPLASTPSRASLNTHTVHRATALLQEALHDSRRATFTQEFGEVRGIHRLSAPPAAEVFVDTGDADGFTSPPINHAFVEAYLGFPPADARASEDDSAPQTRPGHAADAQLRGLIHDFRERQRQAGLVVAGSIAAAVALTVLTIALVFAMAT